MLGRLIILIVAMIMAMPVVAQKDEDGKRDFGKTRRTPTMREAVYKKLSEAQELADADDLAGADKSIDALEKIRNLNSYELAQMYNFRAFLAYARDDYPGAVRAYENLLAQPDLPEALEHGTIYSVAQLYFAQERYDKAVENLERWFEVVNNPNPNAYNLLGQGYYLLKRYRDAITQLTKAIDLQQMAGKPVSENWYLMLRGCYYELGDFNAVVEIQEKLIYLNPKKQYWVELSGFYSEIDEDEKQLHALDLAHRQGLLNRGAEYITLCQLLMQAEVPYRGAKVLQEGMDKGLVKPDSKNLRLLSQAWMMSKEFDRAIGPLSTAAKLSDDGELYYHLANSLWNLQRYTETAEAAAKALEKGGLKRADQVLILRGMALFNVANYDAASRVFRQAQQDRRSNKSASQWLNFIGREQERLALLEDSR
jgi:tetratricopeptide (TPR) repeat protein